ncbi:hypothetical protein NPIL_80131 [Nephila pilipes]|uniref:Uncharacterized protein n=1 Tax=Nephila pilipes TaxID=299642 RepID=A0A8X6Q7L6_NEPPI|nr:hypothetical protein NPIL_80131 [Nephila pilipes]
MFGSWVDKIWRRKCLIGPETRESSPSLFFFTAFIHTTFPTSLQFHLEDFSSTKRFHTLSGAFYPKNLPQTDTHQRTLPALRTKL